MLKEKVKEYRSKNKLTQKEFASKLGISRGYLSDIESGKVKGNVKILKALANATNVPINFWVNDDEDVNIQPFETLNTIIDLFIDKGLINKENLITGHEESILEIVRKEVALKLERLEKEKEVK